MRFTNMTNSKNPLQNILFVSIPENLDKQFNSLKLDPSVLLPVEVPEGISPADWKMEDLSWEMIISGMLKILAYQPSHEHCGYFREFVLAAKPEIINELTQSAIIKSQSHNYDLAEEIFLALKGLKPEDLRIRLNLAILEENRGNHLLSLNRQEEGTRILDTAEDLYTTLLDSGENLPDIYFNAAWFYFSRQNFSRASELASSFLTLTDDETKKEEAERLLRECGGLKERNTEYRNAYEDIAANRDAEGLEKVEAFLKENPDIWNAWFLKGWALRKLERYPEALTAFNRARDLKSDQAEILNEMAICQLELGDYAASSELLQKAFSLEPDNLKVISNMGILALKQERKEEAAGFFRTVLELEPEDPIALQYLDFLKKSSETS